MLTLSAMLKPQGLFFIVPVLIYLGLRWWERRGPALPAFVAGVTVTYALTILFLVLGGGRAGAIARNYLSVGQDAPFLCVECINVWRPIVRVLQAVLGQSGRTYDLRLPEPLYSVLLLGAQALALTLVFAFALTLIAARAPSSAEGRGRRLGTLVRWSAAAGLVLVVAGLARVSGADQNPVVFGRYSVRYAGILALAALVAAVGIVVAPVIGRVLGRVPELARRAGVDGGAGASGGEAAAVLLLLAFAALVIPQIGGQAHINHAYAGLVLAIPAAVARRKILAAWSVMVVAQLVAHLSAYQLGRSLVVPEYMRRSGVAGTLLDAIERAAPASDPWLRFQTTATRLLRDALPQEPLLTLLAAAQFLAFLVIVREMFAMAAALPADAAGRATKRAGRAPLAILVGER
jgi:hypothetical protein